MLKMKDGRKMFTATIRLLKVFLCLQPQQTYVRSIVSQLLTLIYWEQKKDVLPFWDVFINDPATFNEEPVEVSFSLLGRASANDSRRSDINKMEQKYIGVRAYLDAKRDFVTDLATQNTMKSVSGRFKVKKTSQKLQQIKQFVLQMINSARHNSYAPYNNETAFKSALQANLNKLAPTADVHLSRLYDADAAAVLDQERDNIRKAIETNWGTEKYAARYAHMRPPANEQPPMQQRSVEKRNRENKSSSNIERRVSKKANEESSHIRNGRWHSPSRNEGTSSKRSKFQAGGSKGRTPVRSISVDDDSDEVSDDVEDESDDTPLSRVKASRGRQAQSQCKHKSKDFSNKLASLDAPEKALLDAKVAEWRASNTGKIPYDLYERFWAEACEEIRIQKGGNSSRGRRASRKPNGFTYSSDAHPLDVDTEQERMQRAIVMSMKDKK
jgi:hypothetical protein